MFRERVHDKMPIYTRPFHLGNCLSSERLRGVVVTQVNVVLTARCNHTKRALAPRLRVCLPELEIRTLVERGSWIKNRLIHRYQLANVPFPTLLAARHHLQPGPPRNAHKIAAVAEHLRDFHCPASRHEHKQRMRKNW